MADRGGPFVGGSKEIKGDAPPPARRMCPLTLKGETFEGISFTEKTFDIKVFAEKTFAEKTLRGKNYSCRGFRGSAKP